MKLLNLIVCLLLLPTAILLADEPGKKVAINPTLLTYINKVKSDFSKIPKDRKEELDKITLFIQNRVNSAEPVQLTYICTHNSRRSHFGQI